MTFNTWFANLQTRTATHRGAGLVAFKELLVRLNNPQQNYKIIHVAGTNGKGTVCTLLAHTLTQIGEKTGLFISPHLISPTERIQIDGVEILPDDFINAAEKVLALQKEPLNFFEVLTAAALVYFAEKGVRYAVLETGLGGRKDPTNICTPVLSIITSVGLDHTQILGDTLTKIAAEKAGIIKPGVPVLCGYLSPEAELIILKTAREKKAPLTLVGEETLPGRAQAQNICLVRRAANLLGIDDAAVQACLKTVRLPGRFEIIRSGNKTFVLDGAHNLPAVENLLAFWRTSQLAAKPAAVLCGFMKDKDFPQMLGLLAKQFKQGVVTLPSLTRGASEQEIRFFLPPGWAFIPDGGEALSEIQTRADTILCTGSFYLVGAVRKALQN